MQYPQVMTAKVIRIAYPPTLILVSKCVEINIAVTLDMTDKYKQFTGRSFSKAR